MFFAQPVDLTFGLQDPMRLVDRLLLRNEIPAHGNANHGGREED